LFAGATPNPNNEVAVPTIIVEGHGPGHQAGHMETGVNQSIYVFGGSCGSNYLGAPIYMLDMDPLPLASTVRQPAIIGSSIAIFGTLLYLLAMNAMKKEVLVCVLRENLIYCVP
jgi:hypothetical protein